MADLFDYLSWRGDLSLECDPFNEVDAMIISRFSYLPFEYAMRTEDMKGKTASELCEIIGKVPNIRSMLIYKDDLKLIEAIKNSPRIGLLRVFGYVNDIDEDTQTQFSAITVELTPGRYYICYRGTDLTIIGWKEDLNMGFICPVPSQTLALKYLEQKAFELNGSLILGGHSKGGNLAVYAAVYADIKIQNRIEAIYNFDGPGFNEKVLKYEGFGRVWERIYTYVPQSSIVGMILGHDENYMTVQSCQVGGLLQHDTYSWFIECTQFVYLENVDKSSRAIDYAMKEWISGMSIKERERFIEVLYEIFSTTKAKTVKEFGENWFQNAGTILKTVKNLDEGTKKAVSETILSLIKSTKNGIIHVIKREKNNG